jgi:hypothetical protein
MLCADPVSMMTSSRRGREPIRRRSPEADWLRFGYLSSSPLALSRGIPKAAPSSGATRARTRTEAGRAGSSRPEAQFSLYRQPSSNAVTLHLLSRRSNE